MNAVIADGPVSMKRYLYALGVVVVLSLVGMMGFTLYSDFHNAVAQEQARLVTLSRVIANNTSVLLNRNQELMADLAKRPEVQAMDPAHCGTLFSDLRLLFPEFANVATVDLNGSAPCSAVPQPGGKPVSVAKTEWFRRAVAERRFIVGKPFIGPITGKVVSVLVEPVWGESHELRGFVGLPLDLERFNPRIPAGTLPEGARFGFISGDGIMVWRNDDPDREKLIGKYVGNQTGPKLALQIRDGEAETVGTDGVSRYYAFVSVPEADWVVFSGVPSRLIVETIRGRAMRNVLIGATGLCLIGLLVRFLMRRIDRIENDLILARDAAEAARRALEAANMELEEFSYSMSHDMRTPLRAIDGFSKILLDEHGEGLDDEGKRLQAVVRDNARYMGRLVDDILDFLKMRKRKIVAGQIDIAALTREAFTEEQATASHGRNLRLVVGTLPPAWGDREMIGKVLRNLLSNAVKFSSPERETVIEVGGAADAQENTYYVKDNGVGFDMRYAGKLFKVFERLHPTGQYEGTAVGLAIVKRIVERHGGRIWPEGKVGEGATFHFTLPHGDSAEDRQGSGSASS